MSNTRIRSSEPLPSAVRHQIHGWLDDNLVHLIRAAAARFGLYEEQQLVITKYDTARKSPRHDAIHHLVMGARAVVNFPCFVNVLRTTFKLLYRNLDALLNRGKEEVFLSTSRHTVRLRLPKEENDRLQMPFSLSYINEEDRHSALLFQGSETGSNDTIINPSIYVAMGHVGQQMYLPHAEQYWSVIRFASDFDRNPVNVGSYIVRHLLRMKDTEKLKREHFIEVFGMIAGGAEREHAAERARDAISFMNNLHQEMRLRLDQTTPKLIAALSVSWALAARILVVDKKCTVSRDALSVHGQGGAREAQATVVSGCGFGYGAGDGAAL
ncbi:hypothetical protein FGB62_140g037 [Gracilaria domingensis]|nr:hypothetical protein FGB62_140g037 [Gracilaria domingensis]